MITLCLHSKRGTTMSEQDLTMSAPEVDVQEMALLEVLLTRYRHAIPSLPAYQLDDLLKRFIELSDLCALYLNAHPDYSR